MPNGRMGACVTTRSGETYLSRAAAAEDEQLVRTLLEHESADDIRYRFFVSMREFDHDFLCRLLSVDDARATSLIAIAPNDGSAAGLACLHRLGEEPRAEFAILVRSDLKGHGLGYRLMERLISEARAKSYDTIEGYVLWGNSAMREFCRSMGFHFGVRPRRPHAHVGGDDAQRAARSIARASRVIPSVFRERAAPHVTPSRPSPRRREDLRR